MNIRFNKPLYFLRVRTASRAISRSHKLLGGTKISLTFSSTRDQHSTAFLSRSFECNWE